MGPNSGWFGIFGGRFVPEILMEPLLELEEAYFALKREKSFWREFERYLKNYCGRPTPLYFAENLSRKYGVKIHLKREDLNPTGAHKITNCIGQAILAWKMGKRRLVAETGAGQHGVAVATVGALFGFECTIYMGERDMERQIFNVGKMRLLGAEVVKVPTGSGTLKDATSEAIRDWVAHFKNAHYLLGSAVGPHPYPLMVRDFQAVMGREVKEQMKKRLGRMPDYLVACIGGGSNAIGLFHPFIRMSDVKMVGVEGGGKDEKHHAMSLLKGKTGIFHGAMSYILQDEEGQILESHSISAGLDYPGVGPEISYLVMKGRIMVDSVSDEEALKAFQDLAETEGVIPALESSHALAWIRRKNLSDGKIVVCNLSGRGEKDMNIWEKGDEKA